MILGRRVIGHHLIFSSYGFWLANDPRGSGSKELLQEKFEELGPIHPGRKREQPTRESLRRFYEQATPLLEFAPVWFGKEARGGIAESFGWATRQFGYTVWGLAVVSNHAHLVVRAHRDTYEVIWGRYAGAAKAVVRGVTGTPPDHPVWADRPYSVYQYTPDDVRRTMAYVEGNPGKEGLRRQDYSWVKTYTGWPLSK